MLHLLPADEADRHNTHPARRCPCGGHLELVDTGEHVDWQYVHQALDDEGSEEGEPT